MRGRLYLDTMHVDHANLIMRYLSIWWSDLEIEHTIAIVRTSWSFLWYAMNELMHGMQGQIDVCNAIMIFAVHGWSFKSFSLIKSWVQNWVSIGMTPICPPILMLSYSTLHERASKCNLFFYIPVWTEKKKKRQKIRKNYEKVDWKPENAIYAKGKQ